MKMSKENLEGEGDCSGRSVAPMGNLPTVLEIYVALGAIVFIRPIQTLMQNAADC